MIIINGEWHSYLFNYKFFCLYISITNIQQHQHLTTIVDLACSNISYCTSIITSTIITSNIIRFSVTYAHQFNIRFTGKVSDCFLYPFITSMNNISNSTITSIIIMIISYNFIIRYISMRISQFISLKKRNKIRLFCDIQYN